MAPATSTRTAPNLSATMPANTPARPQEMFWIAMASEKLWRVQSMDWVTGSSHRPKPWRMPMDMVTMAAPQSSNWVRDRGLCGMEKRKGREAECGIAAILPCPGHRW